VLTFSLTRRRDCRSRGVMAAAPIGGPSPFRFRDVCRFRHDRFRDWFRDGLHKLRGHGRTCGRLRRLAKVLELDHGWPFFSSTRIWRDTKRAACGASRRNSARPVSGLDEVSVEDGVAVVEVAERITVVRWSARSTTCAARRGAHRRHARFSPARNRRGSVPHGRVEPWCHDRSQLQRSPCTRSAPRHRGANPRHQRPRQFCPAIVPDRLHDEDEVERTAEVEVERFSTMNAT
jgi:hypothetical protein